MNVENSLVRVEIKELKYDGFIPSNNDILSWVHCAIKEYKIEICLKIVTKSEMQYLNNKYRSKNKPTNVLSFNYNIPKEISDYNLADIILCADIINEEAESSNRNNLEYWAHMVIHGCLHILGYDHINDKDAKIMEEKEIDVMYNLGYKNPYIF